MVLRIVIGHDIRSHVKRIEQESLRMTQIELLELRSSLVSIHIVAWRFNHHLIFRRLKICMNMQLFAWRAVFGGRLLGFSTLNLSFVKFLHLVEVLLPLIQESLLSFNVIDFLMSHWFAVMWPRIVERGPDLRLHASSSFLYTCYSC